MSSKSFQIGLLSLCLTMPVVAAPHHRSDTKVVDVNAHALPPLPSGFTTRYGPNRSGSTGAFGTGDDMESSLGADQHGP